MPGKIKKYLLKPLHFVLKNIIRLVFFLVVAAAVAGAAAWFLALKYFNAAAAGSLLTQGLQQAFNRPVAMESIKLISLNAVEIKNLRVVDTDLSFYNDLISAGSIIIRYDLMPIIDGRIVINEVILNGPAINIVKDANGAVNIDGLKIGGKESRQGTQFEVTSPGGRALQVIIEDWAIKGGTFSYRDIPGKASHSLTGISVSLPNLRFKEFTDYSASFLLRNKIKDMVIETEISSKGQINLADLKPREMELKNSKVEIRGFKKPLSLSIDAKNLANPKIKLSAALPDFSYEDISLFIPKPVNFKAPAFRVKADIAFTDDFKKININSLNLKSGEITADISARADLSQKPLFIEGKIKTKEFDIAAADFFGFLSKFAIKGKMSAEGSFVYKDGKAAVPKAAAELNGVSAFISNFTIQDVKAHYEAENNFDVMNAGVNAGVFKVGRQAVTQIKGRASYEHQKQNFYALLDNAKFNGQKIKMSVAISKVRNAKKRVIKTMLHVAKFNPVEVFDTVEDFAEALSPAGGSRNKRQKDTSDLAWLRNFRAQLPSFMPNINGLIFADTFESPVATGKNMTAEVDIKGLLPGMNKLAGKVDARMENGTILKMQETADKWKALGIAFQPFVIMNNMERAGSFKMGQVLKDTPFEILTLSADFNNGKMDINNFYLDGRVIAASLEGKADWVGESLDLDISTMFKNTSRRGALSENLTDESGEPALAFKTSGNMQKPSVQVKSPKKTGSKIKAAKEKGLRTNFKAIQKFTKEQ
jgi:hypothetical protein